MVRLKSFQFFYWLVVITFVGLMGLVTFIRPLDHKQQELLQAIDREPLVLLENDTTTNTKVLSSNNQNESLFNETKTITTIEDKVETTIKPVTKKSKTAKEAKKPMVTTAKTTTTEVGPSLVKEDFTTSLRKVKIGKKVNITYDSPIKYKGPIGNYFKVSPLDGFVKFCFS